jgi:long-chain acyl-CoA synthetase
VADDCVDQAVVCGVGRQFVTALLVPHCDNLRRVIADGGRRLPGGATDDELARHPAVRDEPQRHVSLRLADVAGCERVKQFLVLPRPFTVAAGELTVSLKMRRRVSFERHHAELEALYHD